MTPRDERPTAPPSIDDEFAALVAERLAREDKIARERQPDTSNLLRALAEGWHAFEERAKVEP
jgi:hypothetical protein